MINKHDFKILNDKKKLHKIGKKWVTVSALTLALLSGGVALNTHTQVNAQQNKTPVVSNTSENPQKDIQEAANNLHKNLYNAATQSSTKTIGLLKKSGNSVSQDGLNNVQSKDNTNNNADNQSANFKNSDNSKLNNMNGTNAYTKDSNGNWSEKTQIVLEYTQTNENNEKPLKINPMTASELQDFNNNNIGVMPLYNSVSPTNFNGNLVTPTNDFQESDYIKGASDQGRIVQGKLIPEPYVTNSDNMYVYSPVTATSRYNLLHNLGYGSYLGNGQFATIKSYNYATIYNNFQPSDATLFGYILTAPRNTNLKPLFTKYLYPQTLDGYCLDNNLYDGTMFSVKGNGTILLPNQLTFPSSENIAKESTINNGQHLSSNTSVDSGSTGSILLTYAKQNDTITYTYNGKKINQWSSQTTGSSNDQNPELSTLYDNIQQSDGNTLTPSTNYGLPRGYYIDSTTFSDFLNTLYNASQTEKTHITPGLNYGRHYVVPVQSTLPPVSTITVHYVDVDTKNDKVIKSDTPVTNYRGTLFSIKPYQNNIPSGYRYVGVRDNINKFNNHNHTVDILVHKIESDPSILVQIITHKHGKILNSFTTTKKRGTTFNINDYKQYIPKGYYYVKNVNVPKIYNINVPRRIVSVIVAKKKTPIKPVESDSDGSIQVQFITKQNKVISAITTTKNRNASFDISDYLNYIPTGYHLVMVGNNVSNYNKNPSIVDVVIDKNHKSNRPNQNIKQNGSILVQIVTDDHNKVLSNFLTTRGINTPFDVNTYKKYIPKGYYIVSTINNANSYQNLPQTATIVVGKNGTNNNQKSASSSTNSSSASKASGKANKASSAKSSQSNSASSSKSSTQPSGTSVPSNNSSNSSLNPSSSISKSSSIASSSKSKKPSSASISPSSVNSNSGSSSFAEPATSTSSSSVSSTVSSMPSSVSSASSIESSSRYPSSISSKMPSDSNKNNKHVGPSHKKHNHGFKKHNIRHTINRIKNNQKIKNEANYGSKYRTTNHGYDLKNERTRLNNHQNNNVTRNKLPQTNEFKNYTTIFGLIMIVLSIIFMALYNIDRKHNTK